MPQSRLNYFEWLTEQIGIPFKGDRSFQNLFLKMFETEFVWTISGDDNRAKDALDLRHVFSEGNLRNVQFPEFVTVLEVLIGLSRRLAFLAGGEAPLWAWQLIQNLHLDGCSDPLSRTASGHIDEVMNALVWRTYQRDGRGGFFPLQYTEEDQRHIELWYQMQAYISEIQEPE